MKPAIKFAIALAVVALPSLALLARDKPQSNSSAPATDLHVAPDLAQRVAKFKRVPMPFHMKSINASEQKMVEKLIDAAALLDDVYWRQSDPEGLKLYLSLADRKDPQDMLLRRYLMINGGRFDLVDGNKPFVGNQTMPPGRGFFPEDLTRAEFDRYVAAHPDQKEALYNGQTVVHRLNAGLVAIPYHAAYKQFVDPMAQDLRDAAALSTDPAFAKFLRMRADALQNDDYFASDVQWLDLQNPKFDVIFAPYETYLDSFLGVKTSYGASVVIRDEAESQKLAVFQKYVPDLQEALPLPPADLPSKRGKQSPMEVVDAIYQAGDLRHGYQAVADNLPNDPRIQQQKGSKKIFWRNFNDARVNQVILPLAKRIMRADQASMASGEGYLYETLLHEISHGLGPAYGHTAKGQTDIREAIGPQYSSLEESKADVVGCFDLQWLVSHGALPKEKQNEVYASYVAGIFRTVRFGIAEAHGQGQMMEFNYLVEKGALRLDPATKLYEIDFTKMPAAIASLAKELLEIEATGDRARAGAWFKKYAVMPAELSAALAKATDIPVDFEPEYSFERAVR